MCEKMHIVNVSMFQVDPDKPKPGQDTVPAPNKMVKTRCERTVRQKYTTQTAHATKENITCPLCLATIDDPKYGIEFVAIMEVSEDATFDDVDFVY